MAAKLSQETYELVRGLLNADKERQTIADLFGLSRATINRISRTESFEEYKVLQKSYKKEKPEKAEQITLPVMPSDNDLCLLMKEQTEVLIMLHEKITRILDLIA